MGYASVSHELCFNESRRIMARPYFGLGGGGEVPAVISTIANVLGIQVTDPPNVKNTTKKISGKEDSGKRLR